MGASPLRRTVGANSLGSASGEARPSRSAALCHCHCQACISLWNVPCGPGSVLPLSVWCPIRQRGGEEEGRRQISLLGRPTHCRQSLPAVQLPLVAEQQQGLAGLPVSDTGL